MSDASPARQGNLTGPQLNGNWLDNPYLMGGLSITLINLVPLLLSLLFIFCRLHRFHHCSLFLIEMAVGSLMSEAIMYLLPTVILTGSVLLPSNGVPPHFPRLSTVVASVCLLHALDTASVVFFGRTQSRSHAMEWRNSHQMQQQQQQDQQQQQQKQPEQRLAEQQQQHQQQQQQQQQQQPEQQSIADSEGANSELDVDGNFPKFHCGRVNSDAKSEPDGNESVIFDNENVPSDKTRFRADLTITLGHIVANPWLFLQPGPYRLCSIISAGALLHSFSNGVALGAGFVKSWKTGVHLSLSVGMHELAHNVAEFAVLTASGFSLAAILLMNLFNWVASFLGVFMAVPLTRTSQNLWAWLMTVATAVFVYLALVTMSSMVRQNYVPRHTSAFIFGNVALTTGSIITILASSLEFLVFS